MHKMVLKMSFFVYFLFVKCSLFMRYAQEACYTDHGLLISDCHEWI